jgi:hypothetical protein
MAEPHIITIYHVLDLRASPSPKGKTCHMTSCGESEELAKSGEIAGSPIDLRTIDKHCLKRTMKMETL